MIKKTFLLVVVTSLGVTTIGCAQETISWQTYEDWPAVRELHTIEEEISDFQNEAIADGEISAEEYERAFRNFQSCMEHAGYAISVGEKVNQVYDYSYSDAAREHVFEQCYGYEFRYVDAGWQMKPEILENSQTSRLTKQCLIDHGHEPAPTFPERMSQMEHFRIAFDDCDYLIGKV